MEKLKEKKPLIKRKKREKGITLIALVVTIVVLLILAAVSITALVGENGLITRAKLAAEKTNQSVQNDIAAMEELNQQLEDLVNKEPNSTEVFAEDIGKKVDYVAKDYTDLTWRIFYYDETYVYLISEKTSDGSNPVTSCVLSDKISGKYTNGSDEIDSNLRFLNQQWYTQLNGTKSTTDNAKAVAYLMDQSEWSGYKDSEGKAAYAIGGPTLELLKNSYNATSIANSREHQILITTCTTYGYDQNTTDDWLLNEYNNGIYGSKTTSNWWIASPRAYGVGGDVFFVNSYIEYLQFISTKGSNGLRPIVLIPKTNFQYEIISE